MDNWNTYVKEYQNYLHLERGLSKNTIENYTFDIEKLIDFLIENAIEESPLTISEDIIQQFIYQIGSVF